MRKKALSLFLALVLLLGMTPGYAAAAEPAGEGETAAPAVETQAEEESTGEADLALEASPLVDWSSSPFWVMTSGDWTPYGTLQAAIDSIPTSVRGVIAMSQNVTLNSPVDAKGRSFTLTSAADGTTYVLSRDSGFTQQMLTVGTGSDVTIRNLVLDGGYNNGSKIQAATAAVHVDGGSLTLSDGAVIRNNYNATTSQTAGGDATKYGGGAVVNNSGTLTIQNGASVTGNYSGYAAGGVLVMNSAKLIMTEGEITDNSCFLGGGVQVMSEGKVVLSNASIIKDNTYDMGVVSGTSNLYLTAPDQLTVSGTFTGTVGITSQSSGMGAVFGRAEAGAVLRGTITQDSPTVGGNVTAQIDGDNNLIWTRCAYVSSTGSNSGDGTRGNPYQTLEGAVTALSSSTDASGSLITQNATIYIMDTVNYGKLNNSNSTIPKDCTVTIMGDPQRDEGTVAKVVDNSSNTSHMFNTRNAGTLILRDVTFDGSNKSRNGFFWTNTGSGNTLILGEGAVVTNFSASTYGLIGATKSGVDLTVKLEGGTVTDNTVGANGAIAYGYNGSGTVKVEVSGDSVVTGNLYNGNECNICVNNVSYLTLTGDFTGSIGVTPGDSVGTTAGSQFGTAAGGASLSGDIFCDTNTALVGQISSTRLVWARAGLYVSSTGEDSPGRGTKDKPYATLEYAYTRANAGETIRIMDQVTVNDNILVTKNMTITGADVDGTPFENAALVAGGELHNSTINTSAVFIFQGSGNTLSIDNLLLDGNGENTRAARVWNGGTLNLRDVTVTGWGMSAFAVNTNLTLSGEVTITDNPGGGISFHGGTGRLTLNAGKIVVCNIGKDGTQNNISLDSNAILTVAGQLEEGSRLGVTDTWSGAANAANEQFGTNCAGEGNAAYFFNDRNANLIAGTSGENLVWMSVAARTSNDGGTSWTCFSSLKSAVDAVDTDDGTASIVEVLRDLELAEGVTAAESQTFTLRSGTREEDAGRTYAITRTASVTLLTIDGSVTMENIILDGGAVYGGSENWWDTSNITGIDGGVNRMVRVSSAGSLTLDNGSVLRNAAWTGGTSYGAALWVDGGTVTVKDGAVITKNVVASTGPAIFASNGAEVIIQGGTIKDNACTASQGVVTMDANGNLTMTGGEISGNYGKGCGAAIYTQNGQNITLNISGGRITGNRGSTDNPNAGNGIHCNSNTKLILSGNPFIYDNKNGYDEQRNIAVATQSFLTVSGTLAEGSKVGIIDFWGGAENTAGEVFGSSENAAGLEALVNDVNGALHAAVTADGKLQWAAEKQVAQIVGGAANGATYPTLADAILAYKSGDSYIEMIDNSTEDPITVEKTVYVDLAGFTVTANVTVSGEGSTFYGFDTATDGYNAQSAEDFGHIIGTVSGSVAGTTATDASQTGTAKRYVTITEQTEDGATDTSFHRFDMKLGSVVFRPAVAGIYFKSEFYGDEWVKNAIRTDEALTYGLFLGLSESVEPGADNAAAHNPDVFQAGAGGDKRQGSMVQNIVVEGREDNAGRTATPIYVSTYFNFEGAGVVRDVMRSTTLTRIVELTIAQYNAGTLTQAQKRDFDAFWSKFGSLYSNLTQPEWTGTEET